MGVVQGVAPNCATTPLLAADGAPVRVTESVGVE
jgi:hypothetical protein